MKTLTTMLSLALLCAWGAGCEDAENASEDGSGDTDSDSDSDTDSDADSDSDADTDADSDADTDADSDTDNELACDVDLLFVIDNSGSMSDYQTALGLAFAGFADALIETLNDETNLHVGVTSTEMGFSSSGMTSIMGDECTFTGDGDQDETAFYITPDVTDTGVNGAQGRLYKPTGQPEYFEMDVGAPQEEVDELKTWFQAAAAVGTGGSNIEMLAAPVAWVGDPVNSATNEGFIRDEDTVMVVFFMQDEPDQTPVTIEDTPGGEYVLDRLVAEKEVCGGLDCIVAGGFTDPDECFGTRPIRGFLDGLTRPYAIAELPWSAPDPTAMAEEMTELLTTTLLETIDDTCDDIVIE